MAKNQPTRLMKRIFNEVFRNVDLDDERNIDHLPNLKSIKNSLYLYMNGTFKTAPEMFSQMYSIHISNLGTVLPMTIALLPAKTHWTN